MDVPLAESVAKPTPQDCGEGVRIDIGDLVKFLDRDGMVCLTSGDSHACILRFVGARQLDVEIAGSAVTFDYDCISEIWCPLAGDQEPEVDDRVAVTRGDDAPIFGYVTEVGADGSITLLGDDSSKPLKLTAEEVAEGGALEICVYDAHSDGSLSNQPEEEEEEVPVVDQASASEPTVAPTPAVAAASEPPDDLEGDAQQD